MNGEVRTEISIQIINTAVEQLKKSNTKVNLSNIANLALGLSMATIKRHWRKVVPKTDPQAELINEIDNSSMKKIKATPTQENEAEYIQHTLSDGRKIYCIQYFIKHYKMDNELADDCYRSQFFVDTTMAKTRKEFDALKQRQLELNALASLV